MARRAPAPGFAAGSQFVTNLSPRAVVRVKIRAFRAGFLLHNPFRERWLCDGARRGIRTPDQLCVRQMCGWGGWGGAGRRCYDGLRLAWLERICGEGGVACFSEFCGPLPDLGAAANDPCVASPAASRRVRPSGSLAAGYLAPLGSDLSENVAEHR